MLSSKQNDFFLSFIWLRNHHYPRRHENKFIFILSNLCHDSSTFCWILLFIKIYYRQINGSIQKNEKTLNADDIYIQCLCELLFDFKIPYRSVNYIMSGVPFILENTQTTIFHFKFINSVSLGFCAGNIFPFRVYI